MGSQLGSLEVSLSPLHGVKSSQLAVATALQIAVATSLESVVIELLLCRCTSHPQVVTKAVAMSSQRRCNWCVYTQRRRSVAVASASQRRCIFVVVIVIGSRSVVVGTATATATATATSSDVSRALLCDLRSTQLHRKSWNYWNHQYLVSVPGTATCRIETW